MIVMPANATGWLWHTMARETGRIGHLYSPGAQNGPWPWLPYALDNGAFSLWSQETNDFDEDRWRRSAIDEWRRMLFWATSSVQKPRWAIVPDRPGSWEQTLVKWRTYAQELVDCGIPLAVAVQDGAEPSHISKLVPAPAVVAVGGSTEWKWRTAELWLRSFPRVHLLRCNSPEKLYWLEERNCESCDGTGWNRGDVYQTRGLEEWARSRPQPNFSPLWRHACTAKRKSERNQLTFA